MKFAIPIQQTVRNALIIEADSIDQITAEVIARAREDQLRPEEWKIVEETIHPTVIVSETVAEKYGFTFAVVDTLEQRAREIGVTARALSRWKLEDGVDVFDDMEVAQLLSMRRTLPPNLSDYFRQLIEAARPTR